MKWQLKILIHIDSIYWLVYLTESYRYLLLLIPTRFFLPPGGQRNLLRIHDQLEGMLHYRQKLFNFQVKINVCTSDSWHSWKITCAHIPKVWHSSHKTWHFAMAIVKPSSLKVEAPVSLCSEGVSWQLSELIKIPLGKNHIVMPMCCCKYVYVYKYIPLLTTSSCSHIGK